MKVQTLIQHLQDFPLDGMIWYNSPQEAMVAMVAMVAKLEEEALNA